MKPIVNTDPAIWFPAIRTSTGTDVFTETLSKGLQQRGYQAEITWLPHRTEYAPWTVPIPKAPAWANVIHTNTRLHPRFLQEDIPIVSTMHLCVHDKALDKYKSSLQKLYHRFWVKPLETTVLNKSSTVAAVSEYTAKQTSNIFKKNNINIIYNGIDHNIFTAKNYIRSHKPFRLLFVGSWTSRKGVDLLAPIMNQLGSSFELLYTGTVKENLPKNTRCIGKLKTSNEMLKAYHSADALLFPTRLEGFGLVALEAQACGLPVIASNCSSIPEVVANGETGLLCPQDDVEAFIGAARFLAEKPNAFKKMGQAGRIRFIKYFDLDVMIDGYVSLYQVSKKTIV